MNDIEILSEEKKDDLAERLVGSIITAIGGNEDGDFFLATARGDQFIISACPEGGVVLTEVQIDLPSNIA